jgi:hypothetical protein
MTENKDFDTTVLPSSDLDLGISASNEDEEILESPETIEEKRFIESYDKAAEQFERMGQTAIAEDLRSKGEAKLQQHMESWRKEEKERAEETEMIKEWLGTAVEEVLIPLLRDPSPSNEKSFLNNLPEYNQAKEYKILGDFFGFDWNKDAILIDNMEPKYFNGAYFKTKFPDIWLLEESSRKASLVKRSGDSELKKILEKKWEEKLELRKKKDS